MSADTRSWLADLIEKHDADLLAEWVREQRTLAGRSTSTTTDDEARDQSRRLLTAVRKGLVDAGLDDLAAPAWAETRDVLGEVSRERAIRGSSPSDTARFVFSLKQPLFARIRREVGNDAGRLAEQTWAGSLLIDSLGLYTTEVFQKTLERPQLVPLDSLETLKFLEQWRGDGDVLSLGPNRVDEQRVASQLTDILCCVLVCSIRCGEPLCVLFWQRSCPFCPRKSCVRLPIRVAVSY